jgi:hypothetical protein
MIKQLSRLPLNIGFRKLKIVMLMAKSWVYNEQVAYYLSTEKVPSLEAISCPTGFTIRSISGPADYPLWIRLLNKDGGFGYWDEDRLQSELIDNLCSPTSTGFLFKGDQLVGAASICFTKFQGNNVPSGKFLIIDPGFRGSFKVAYCLYSFCLAIAASLGYSRVFASTYPDRLPALTLYLSNDLQVCYTNLWSYVQWYRIRKRVGPAAERLRRRLAS